MNTHILPLALLLLPSAASKAAPVAVSKNEKTETSIAVNRETSPVNRETSGATFDSDTIPPLSIDLEDVEVVATRPVIKSDGAKLTYDLREDISTKGMTLNDALRKVPMVTVDGEGNIRINGQANFKIFVNGKEDPSLSANYKDLFKAMPADAVQKVEVITEPGAKYDAEGTAGILNLVTISKNSTDGYSATINARFTKQQTGASLYGRMKRGRLSMSTNFDYANGSIFPQTNWNEHEIENLSSENLRYQYNKIQQRIGWDYIGGGLNLSYDLSDADLLTLNANVSTMGGELLKGGYSYFEAFGADHKSVGNSMRSLQGKLTETNLNAGLSWQHSFGQQGTKFILSYLFNHGYRRLDASLSETEAEGISVVSPYEFTSDKTTTNEHTVQLDFVKPLGECHSLDAGGKLIFRRNPAVSFTLWTPGSGLADALPGDHSDIIQQQDIYAAYVVYNGKFGPLSTTAGVRYEHTGMGIDFKAGDEPDFFNHMNDVVPNAAIAYNFTETSSLRLAYQMRISRPSLNQVNPYELILIPGVVEKGNPQLESERANKLTLTYSNYAGSIGGNVGIDFSTVGNAISQFTYTHDDIHFSSYANIGRRTDVAAFGYLNWSPIRIMQFSVNARLTHQSMSSESPKLSNSGWTLQYGADMSLRLPSGFMLNLYGGQSTRSYHLQGWQDGWYYYGLGLRRSFLKKDALTVTLTAQQFLQNEIRNRAYTATDNFITRRAFYNKNWNVGINISWTIGSLKSDVKKTARQIENDDKSSVSGKSAM